MTKRNLKRNRGPFDDLFVMPPVSHISVDTWAEQNRVLSSSHSVPGPWRTSEVEAARGMLHAVTEPGVRKISLMTSPQLTKSEILLNTIGYFCDVDPSALLLVQPTQDTAEAFSRERISKLVRETKSLRDKSDLGKRMGEDSLSFKSFRNGAHLAVAYAGAPSQVASRPIRILLCDEIDLWKTNDFGDPLAQAYERVNSYKNSLIVQASTPTWALTSRIASQYNLGDQRRGFVACPHCGEWQVLNFFKNPVKVAQYLCATVEWEKDAPTSAKLWCGKCKAAWTELDRLSAITTEGGIRFQQTRPFVCAACGGDEQHPLASRRWEWNAEMQCGYALCKICNTRQVESTHVSFQVSKLYSPHTNVAELARRWAEACAGLPEAKLGFYQTDLGLPADASTVDETIGTHELLERRVAPFKAVPSWVLRLTAGVDVQHNSLHVLLCGGGAAERCVIVDHRVFPGDVYQADVWDRMYEFLHGKYPFDAGIDGLSLGISAVFVDSGDGTTIDRVHSFVRRERTLVWKASKGSSDTGNVWAPLIPPFQQKATRDSGEANRPVLIGTNSGKKLLYDRLEIREPGPGHISLPEDLVGEQFLEELTSEHLKTTLRQGFKTMRFAPKRVKATNEVLDCWVLSLAALRYLAERKFGSMERLEKIALSQLSKVKESQ